MGEWVFPGVVLGASALVLVLLVRGSAAARPDGSRDARDDPRAGRDEARGPVMGVAAGLAGFVALLNLAGFVAAGTTRFVASSAAFGSRRWLRDALVALLFCVVVRRLHTGPRRSAAMKSFSLASTRRHAWTR